jgi:hypothetical protein
MRKKINKYRHIKAQPKTINTPSKLKLLYDDDDIYDIKVRYNNLTDVNLLFFWNTFELYYHDLKKTGMVFFKFDLHFLPSIQTIYCSSELTEFIDQLNTILADINYIDFSFVFPYNSTSNFKYYFKIIIGIRMYSKNIPTIYHNIAKTLSIHLSKDPMFEMVETPLMVDDLHLTEDLVTFFFGDYESLLDFYLIVKFSDCNKKLHMQYAQLFEIKGIHQLCYNYTWKGLFLGAEDDKKSKYFIDHNNICQLKKGRHFLTKRNSKKS